MNIKEIFPPKIVGCEFAEMDFVKDDFGRVSYSIEPCCERDDRQNNQSDSSRPSIGSTKYWLAQWYFLRAVRGQSVKGAKRLTMEFFLPEPSSEDSHVLSLLSSSASLTPFDLAAFCPRATPPPHPALFLKAGVGVTGTVDMSPEPCRRRRGKFETASGR